MVSETTEDYLAILYGLHEKNPNLKIGTTELAKILNVAPPSVTEMLKKLADKNLVKYEPYTGVSLTKKGLRTGRVMKRRHRLVEALLVNILKLDPNKIPSLAHQIEHTLIPEAEDALCRFLKIPEFSPHRGTFIPPCDHDIDECPKCIDAYSSGRAKRRKFEISDLMSFNVGDQGEVVFLRGRSNILQKIKEKGIRQNHTLTLLEKNRSTGTYQIRVNRRKTSLSEKLAKRIFLRLKPSSKK
jgi:DtxR family Mn-dependent transcriptional regulator